MRSGLEGNLCRCTGYHNIVEAVLAARARRRGVRDDPGRFDYVRAGSVDEAVALLSRARRRRQAPGRRPLAAPAHEAAPGHAGVLIDVGRLREPRYVREEDGHVAIGALTRHHDIATSAVALAERAGARPRRRPGRRPPGAPPRHDRRLDRPRRPGLGPARRGAGARRDASSPRARRGVARSPRRTSSAGSSRRPWPPTSCWSRSGCRHVAAAVVVREVQPARPGLGDRRGSRPRTSDGVGVGLVNMGPVPLRAGGVEAALAAGRARPTPPSAPPRAPSPRRTSTPPSSTAEHLARVLVRRALEEAGV